MKKTVENSMPPCTFVELLNRALQATADPESFARTLLSCLVEAGEAGEAMEAFAPFVREDPELRLAGGEAGPWDDDRFVSPAGGDAVAAGCCRADVRSSRRHRFGIFEQSAGGRSSRANAESIRLADGRATVRPPLADGAEGHSLCASTGPHRRGAGMRPAPLDSHRVEAAIQAGGILAAEAAGGWPVARVEAGTALETFSEAVGL
jgi:hypothetical protein